MALPFSSGIMAYCACLISSAITLLESTCCKKAILSGPSISSLPMWETSKSPHAWRVYRCSATMPVGYCIGISHPPKSTISAPAATWASYS